MAGVSSVRHQFQEDGDLFRHPGISTTYLDYRHFNSYQFLIPTWDVGLPWRDSAGKGLYRYNILQERPVKLRPCESGLGQGIME